MNAPTGWFVIADDLDLTDELDAAAGIRQLEDMLLVRAKFEQFLRLRDAA